MKIAAAFSLPAAVLVALGLQATQDGRRSLRDLEGRFSRSETALAQARREVDQLRAQTSVGLSRLRAELPERDAHDPSVLHRDILGPSVQVSVEGSVGGGTLLYSRDTDSYVVTASHVIQKLLTPGLDEETRAPAEVNLYDDQGKCTDTVEGDVVAWDDRKDLALLRLRTLRELPEVARLASRDALHEIRVFSPIYAVGCPLGHDPLPTPGEVAALNKEVNGERFWMMNAPTIFGNSGGGVFHRETHELIGVSVMVCTYDGTVSTPVPHLGIFVSLETVYDWLDALGYRFLYDPETPPEASAGRGPGAPALRDPPAPAPSPLSPTSSRR